jgi:hypothetical protein
MLWKYGFEPRIAAVINIYDNDDDGMMMMMMMDFIMIMGGIYLKSLI